MGLGFSEHPRHKAGPWRAEIPPGTAAFSSSPHPSPPACSCLQHEAPLQALGSIFHSSLHSRRLSSSLGTTLPTLCSQCWCSPSKGQDGAHKAIRHHLQTPCWLLQLRHPAPPAHLECPAAGHRALASQPKSLNGSTIQYFNKYFQECSAIWENVQCTRLLTICGLIKTSFIYKRWF